MIADDFWRGKRVLLTGHTGFKGGWLSLWLSRLGANVTGCALAPVEGPGFFVLAGVQQLVRHVLLDICDREALLALMLAEQPDIVIHMAAQSLVKTGYQDPVETYQTNVMGTLNLLEAVRAAGSVRSCLVITTDKCYENDGRSRAYSEDDPLGGYDPYSSSKACTEILTASYRRSFFAPERYSEHGTAIATARAGNVIGGGDWAEYRLVPDALRAFAKGETLTLRHAAAVRPWQFVLEPLSGYLMLSEKLFTAGPEFGEAWNFGPDDDSAYPVAALVSEIARQWGEGASWEEQVDSADVHEADQLTLDSAKSRQRLAWRPRMTMQQTVAAIVSWHRAQQAQADMQQVSIDCLDTYVGTAGP